MSLNIRQQKFIDSYLKDGNATKAALAAGYKEKSAYVSGYRLLKLPQVSNAISTKLAKTFASNEVSRDRIVAEYAATAFFDPVTIFNKDTGELIPVAQWPESARRALAGLDVLKNDDGEMLKKVKLNPKVAALDSLSRIYGLMQQESQFQQNVFNIAIVIEGGQGDS